MGPVHGTGSMNACARRLPGLRTEPPRAGHGRPVQRSPILPILKLRHAEPEGAETALAVGL